jgi:hypothetical protein
MIFRLSSGLALKSSTEIFPNVPVLTFLLGPSKVLGFEKLPGLAAFRGSGFLISAAANP